MTEKRRRPIHLDPNGFMEEEITPDIQDDVLTPEEVEKDLESLEYRLNLFKDNRGLQEFIKMVTEDEDVHIEQLRRGADDIREVKFSQGYLDHCDKCKNIMGFLEEQKGDLEYQLKQLETPIES